MQYKVSAYLINVRVEQKTKVTLKSLRHYKEYLKKVIGDTTEILLILLKYDIKIKYLKYEKRRKEIGKQVVCKMCKWLQTT